MVKPLMIHLTLVQFPVRPDSWADDSSIGTANIFKDRIVNARHVHIRGNKYHPHFCNMLNLISSLWDLKTKRKWGIITYCIAMAIYRGRGRTKSHKWGMCYIEEYPEFTGRGGKRFQELWGGVSYFV